MHVHDVNEREPRFTVRRVFLPTRAVESFTVIGPDLRPVGLVDDYLAWLTDCERSPNTVEAYAHDLRAFWTFLTECGLSWDRVGVMELGEFAAWVRRPAENVVVLAEESARLSARTVNRMLSGVVGFYEFQARRGSTLSMVDYGDRGIPNAFLEAPLASTGPWNAARFHDRTYDSLVKQYVAAVDLQTQKRIARKIEQLLLRETPIIIPYWIDGLTATTTRVSGVNPTSIGQINLAQAATT